MSGLLPAGAASRADAPSALRAALDKLYGAARLAACCAMVAILLLVSAQMGSRLVGIVLPGTDEFAGYGVVGAIFLGLAPTLKAGAHIRVMLVLQALPARLARACEVSSLLIALGLVAYFAYWASNFAYQSYQFADVAQGMVKTPLWVPQSAMSLGLLCLVVALVDELVIVLVSTPEDLRLRRAAAEAVEAGEE